MPAEPNSAEMVFAALADGTRRTLLARLRREGGLSQSALGAGQGVTRQAIAKHLKLLRRAGLAQCRRLGREQIWELTPAPLAAAQRELERIAGRWDEALGRLMAHVDREPQ